MSLNSSRLLSLPKVQLDVPQPGLSAIISALQDHRLKRIGYTVNASLGSPCDSVSRCSFYLLASVCPRLHSRCLTSACACQPFVSRFLLLQSPCHPCLPIPLWRHPLSPVKTEIAQAVPKQKLTMNPPGCKPVPRGLLTMEQLTPRNHYSPRPYSS